jgi:bifunctional DNase/RNase
MLVASAVSFQRGLQYPRILIAMEAGMSRLGRSIIQIFAAGVLLLVAPSCGAGEERKRDSDAALIRIEQVEVRVTPIGPVVLLKVQNKAIPIFVDGVVAQSIHGALSGEKLPRPLSHDLMHTILQGFDGKVSRVVITLKGGTYYADLTVLMRGTAKVFDSRSSDAIALAIHFKAPMLVSQDLIDTAGTVLDAPPENKPGGTRL